MSPRHARLHLICLSLWLMALPQLWADTTRVSMAPGGAEGNGDSGAWRFSLSASGRYVAFFSFASNLVADDTNGVRDSFVCDRTTGTTTRVSVSSSGVQGNGDSYYVAISSDGRYAAFMSDATNLVDDDTNGVSDVFVRDLVAGTTTRVSVATGGAQASGGSYYPDLSDDGRYVAFYSDATDLVAGDINRHADVFVHDCQSGSTELVSSDSGGDQGNGGSYNPSISADGRYVAFQSISSNWWVDATSTWDIFLKGPRERDAHSGQCGPLGLPGRQPQREPHRQQ